MLAICYLFSVKRTQIDWRLVVVGIAWQVVIALVLLKVPFIRSIFQLIVDFFVLMITATEQSAQFLFGDLAEANSTFGFAFYVLPTIIFFSALSSLLYFLGILQKVVRAFAWLMNQSMRLSGPESLAVAANIFIGQTEAPLVVKPYLEKMTVSEVNCLMTGGMATIAGGVFGAYIAMLGGDDLASKQLFGMHLLTASIMSAPAAIVAAKMLYPSTLGDKIADTPVVPTTSIGSNVLESLATGTSDGVKLAVNVGAMLLAFMAFIYFGNLILLEVGEIASINQKISEITTQRYQGLTLQFLMGILFAPFAWLLGIPVQDILLVGQMLGEKTMLNEFFAYFTLTDLKANHMITEKSIIVSTYALCGFANFASIGIQIGGIGAIAPGQKSTLAKLGLRALLGGTIACFLTAIVAGVLVRNLS
ncbi:MAG: hypothetical protein HKN87_15900 [Saprospiraceae bacterium]|nr:hypothetical protein [Saprospiraceae bacterium]